MAKLLRRTTTPFNVLLHRMHAEVALETQGKQKLNPVSKKAKNAVVGIRLPPLDEDEIPNRREYEGNYVKISDVVMEGGKIFQAGDIKKPSVSNEILLRTKLENSCLPSQTLIPQVNPSNFVSKPPPPPPAKPQLSPETTECCKAASMKFWS